MFLTEIKRNLFLVLGLTTLMPNLVLANPDCSTNANSEIIDIASCNFEAISLTYFVRDILWCKTLPSPGDLSTCESWGINPFTFTITEDSVTDLQTQRDLSPGRYLWSVLVLDPVWEVKAVATFARVMQGSSGAGKICWTNGATIDRGTSLWREPDRSKWMADCGNTIPSNIPANPVIQNNIFFGPDTFVASYDTVLSDGTREIGYLLDAEGRLATTSSGVTTYVSISELEKEISVSGDPEKVGVFDLTYDRSRGAEAFIDSTLGTSAISRISHGTFTNTVDYREISSE
jgi:hypothetical protein